MLCDFKNETELECAEEIQKCVSRQTAAVIHRLANSVGVSCRAMNRCTSVRMDTLTNHNPNPCLNTLTKILAYLLHTARLAMRLHVLCRMVVRSQKEGENIVIRLHTPEDPLSTGEELLLLHRPKRLAQSTPASSLIGATPSTMMSARVSAKSDLKIFFRFVFIVFYLRFVFMHYFLRQCRFMPRLCFMPLWQNSLNHILALCQKNTIYLV